METTLRKNQKNNLNSQTITTVQKAVVFIFIQYPNITLFSYNCMQYPYYYENLIHFHTFIIQHLGIHTKPHYLLFCKVQNRLHQKQIPGRYHRTGYITQVCEVLRKRIPENGFHQQNHKKQRKNIRLSRIYQYHQKTHQYWKKYRVFLHEPRLLQPRLHRCTKLENTQRNQNAPKQYTPTKSHHTLRKKKLDSLVRYRIPNIRRAIQIQRTARSHIRTQRRQRQLPLLPLANYQR